jgi:hypothetical protein
LRNEIATDPSRLQPVTTPDQPRLPARSVRLVAAALAALLLSVYCFFPTRNHYWDGIGFALNVEGAKPDGDGFVLDDSQEIGASFIHFNPNHLLHNLLVYLVYAPVRLLVPDVRALNVMRAISILSSVAAALLVFLMLARSSRDLRFSFWLTLLMAFSATWWKFSTDANAYIPSVFLLVLCAFLLTNPRSRPRVVVIGILHALSILVHQISVLFFPAAVVAIWTHSQLSRPAEKYRASLAYALTAGLTVITAYCWVWTGPMDRAWSLYDFINWVTSNGADTYAFRSALSSAVESLRTSTRVFFGGRISLALAFVEKPLLVVLVSLMSASLIFFVKSALKIRAGSNRNTAGFALSIGSRSGWFVITWVGVFVLFLFFWLTSYPYYRLYYLPAVIAVLGGIIKQPGLPVMRERLTMLSSFVCFMLLFNFTFFIYPYSKAEATPPISLALGARQVWNEDVLVLYKESTCDNWMMKYFNPHTTWRQVDITDRNNLDQELGNAVQSGRRVWLDTGILGRLERSTEAKQILLRHGRLSEPWGISNRKHHIQFANLLVHKVTDPRHR